VRKKNKKATRPKKEKRLHDRNKNRERYDLAALIEVKPSLKDFLKPNKHGAETIDFSQPKAVKLLNQAILHHYYGITYWDFPEQHLCPPIPGRADYIHYLADLVREDNYGKIPADQLTVCDIGTGASCIYPVIGVSEYQWNFIASDVSAEAIASAEKIIEGNSRLKGKVECRLQKDPNSFFKGILKTGEKIDLSMSNPPFHSTIEEANEGSLRKIKNLTGKTEEKPVLNFSGNRMELVYEGGEFAFIKGMINESKEIKDQCYWFTSLVSKKTNLDKIYSVLEAVNAAEIRTLDLATGNKISRIVAWTFLSDQDQKNWKNSRWQTRSGKSEEE